MTVESSSAPSGALLASASRLARDAARTQPTAQTPATVKGCGAEALAWCNGEGGDGPGVHPCRRLRRGERHVRPPEGRVRITTRPTSPITIRD